jgi:hypothetical protein
MSTEEKAQEESGANLRQESRIKVKDARRIDAKYKFLSNEDEFECDDIFEGVIADLSRGGALLEGVIPDPSWIPHLLDGQIKIGLFLFLPQSEPVKVLGTMRWSRPAEGSAPEDNLCAMGLKFEEISEDHKKNLSKFLIGYLLTKKKLSGGPS